jgi:hypothetical protein
VFRPAKSIQAACPMGPAIPPSPGDPQAEPTIGKAINGDYDLLEAKCGR